MGIRIGPSVKLTSWPLVELLGQAGLQVPFCPLDLHGLLGPHGFSGGYGHVPLGLYGLLSHNFPDDILAH